MESWRKHLTEAVTASTKYDDLSAEAQAIHMSIKAFAEADRFEKLDQYMDALRARGTADSNVMNKLRGAAELMNYVMLSDEGKTFAPQPGSTPAPEPTPPESTPASSMGAVTTVTRGSSPTLGTSRADVDRGSIGRGRVAEPESAAAGTGGEVEGGEEVGSELPKEAPLSITRRQQDLRVGADGRKEQPLVMQLQKIGMSQQSAQQIAKRIGQYLKQRNIPIAEGMLMIKEALLDEAPRWTSEARTLLRYIYGHSRKLDSTDKPFREFANSFILGIHNIAKEQNPDKFRAFLKKRKSPTSSMPPGTIDAISDDELKSLMKYTRNDLPFRRHAKKAFDYRQAKKAAKATRRSDIRSGKEQNVMAKIMARFVSDNQKLLDKDPALKAIFDDPKKFNKLRKSVTSFIRRQFKRRGYSEEEYAKLLQEAFRHELKKMLLEE